MRQITKQAASNFIADRPFNKANMSVTKGLMGETFLFLHGNMIAYKSIKGLFISNAGWFSNTTKERLNAIPGVSIQQIKGVWYLNGKKWNGEWIEVATN